MGWEEDYTLSQKWHKDEWAKARTDQQRFPVLVLATAIDTYGSSVTGSTGASF